MFFSFFIFRRSVIRLVSIKFRRFSIFFCFFRGRSGSIVVFLVSFGIVRNGRIEGRRIGDSDVTGYSEGKIWRLEFKNICFLLEFNL